MTPGSGPHHRGLSRRYLSNAIEASLRRLDTECVDIFFLHRFDDDTPLDETLRAAEDAVRSGKIRYLGVSNFSAWQTMKAAGVAASLGTSPIAAVQPMYNLVKRQAEVEILPMAADAGFGVMPYSPLGGGLLAGRYGGRRRPESGRLIDNPMYATRYGADGYYATASRFCALAEECDVHPAALAVAWVAAHPAVTAPIIGARNIEQLGAVLGALSIEMTSDLWSRIGALTPQPPPATDRNEEVSSFNYDRMLR